MHDKIKTVFKNSHTNDFQIVWTLNFEDVLNGRVEVDKSALPNSIALFHLLVECAQQR